MILAVSVWKTFPGFETAAAVDSDASADVVVAVMFDVTLVSILQSENGGFT